MRLIPLVFVLYDSINNSVFASQVLPPLIKQLARNPQLQIFLVSFEKELPSEEAITSLIPQHPRLFFVPLLKKNPFVGCASLKPAVAQLKAFLLTQLNYTLIARGPIAGWLCRQSLDPASCSHFTVQARGILHEEYRLTQEQQPASTLQRITGWLSSRRADQFEALERAVYQRGDLPSRVWFTIEAVCPAMKTYLRQTYRLPDELITIAQEDIPAPVDRALLAGWRHTLRTRWGLSERTHVYVYNGSGKPWQCPQETVQFFVQEHANNPQTFLLILTQDTQLFESVVQQTNLPATSYRIMQVPHAQIYEYLAACDTGLLFRADHIVNWTSRPTKMLEYQAVGLPIKHNNTVAWLAGEDTRDEDGRQRTAPVQRNYEELERG